MGRPLKGTRPPFDPELTPDFWRDLCGEPEPSQRDQFLWLTIHHVQRMGLAQFTISRVARQLGYSVAMVNHHFGSRDGLIAECAETLYGRYGQALTHAIATAPQNPRDRLAAYIRTRIEWGPKFGGWGVVIHYPNYSFESPLITRARSVSAYKDGINHHFAQLVQLVRDHRHGRINADPVEQSNFPHAAYERDSEDIQHAAGIAFSTIGAATWLGGRLLGAEVNDNERATSQAIIDRETEILLDSVPVLA